MYKLYCKLTFVSNTSKFTAVDRVSWQGGSESGGTRSQLGWVITAPQSATLQRAGNQSRNRLGKAWCRTHGWTLPSDRSKDEREGGKTRNTSLICQIDTLYTWICNYLPARYFTRASQSLSWNSHSNAVQICFISHVCYKLQPIYMFLNFKNNVNIM